MSFSSRLERAEDQLNLRSEEDARRLQDPQAAAFAFVDWLFERSPEQWQAYWRAALFIMPGWLTNSPVTRDYVTGGRLGPTPADEELARTIDAARPSGFAKVEFGRCLELALVLRVAVRRVREMEAAERLAGGEPPEERSSPAPYAPEERIAYANRIEHDQGNDPNDLHPYRRGIGLRHLPGWPADG